MTSWIEQRSGLDAQAIAERQADLVGKPQRVVPVQETDLNDDAKAFVMRMRTAMGLSEWTQLPDYCLTMIRRPELFRCQMEMGAAIYNSRVPPRERELAVLRIGWLLRSPYEWGEHVDVAKRYGVTSEEIERTIMGPSAAGWTAHEAAVLRGVDELLSDHAISDATWGVLAESWDDDALIDFSLVIGQYVANALMLNALRMRLEASNPGLTHR